MRHAKPSFDLAAVTGLLDPRCYQIAILVGLLGYGIGWLQLDVSPGRVALLVGACLVTQLACHRQWGNGRFDPKSAFISSLSLSLLLRTDQPLLAVAAAVIAISSKSLLRVDGRHLFNPTNVGIVVMMAASDGVWVSPGQWGSLALFAFLMAGLGGLVVYRASRSDVTLAFLGCYAALVVTRAVWLGDPITIALHHLQNGGLLVFAFLMISDPKTTPDSRAGRLLFAGLVAAGAGFIEFGLYRHNGPMWALAMLAPLTPVLNRVLPAPDYHWPDPLGITSWSSRPPRSTQKGRQIMTLFRPALTVRLGRLLLLPVAALAIGSPSALAFCGFYVTKADTTLFNRASKVVLVRDGDRTVLTMANDFQGELTDFAVVIPVPTALSRDQIHVGRQAVIDHLDAYTAPRLVEYIDPNPCELRVMEAMRRQSAPVPASADVSSDSALGVTVEATYTVGEYDIVMLSAEQSTGLETWLTGNGYRIPDGATDVLESYIKQGMRFFVARVNLAEQAALGYRYLRPLQIAYESPKFMLPIRLGMVNADGPQDLFVLALTRQGRVETRNYRTVKLATGMELPGFLKQGDEFADFYQAMFARQVDEANRRGVFLEYAWDMGWCDPCAADPLSRDELRELGVFWVDEAARGGGTTRPVGQTAPDVFVTRLHVRYDADHFPDDLRFQQTGDRTNHQGRYVIRQPWTGRLTCADASAYRERLAVRYEQEAQTLARLTGWDLETIRAKMGLDAPPPDEVEVSWWQRLWQR